MTKNKSLLQNVQPWACYLTLRQEESISLCETHIRSNVHTELLWDKICLTYKAISTWPGNSTCSIEGSDHYNYFLLDSDSVGWGWRLRTSTLGDCEATYFCSNSGSLSFQY